MSLINEYVNNLYKKAKQKDQQTIELKEETRLHLTESVEELLRQGYSYSDAFNIAVDRFGGVEQIEKLISIMQIRQKKFINGLLTIGISLLFISSILFILMLFLGAKHDSVYADIAYQLESEHSSTDKDKILNEESFIFEAKTKNQKEGYVYVTEVNSLIPFILKSNLLYEDNNTYITLQVLDIRKIGFVLFIISLTTYHVLFTIWGVVQLFNKGEVKIWRVLSLLLLNIVGYGLITLNKKFMGRMKNGNYIKSNHSSY